MPRIGLIFPGQGSQFVGMGQELIAAFPEAQAVYARADEILGFPLSRVMLSGPESELQNTDVAQPALLTAAYAAWVALGTRWRVPAHECLAAGHSLGEYSALTAAGSLDFAAALRLVRLRGQLMLSAGREKPGSMAAVLSMEAPEVEDLCRRASPEGLLQVANYNCPGQVVVSGAVDALAAFTNLAAETKARVIPLKVSGAFHSHLMQPAAERLARELDRVDFRLPGFPVIANVLAAAAASVAEIRRALGDQVAGSVRWEESIRFMAASGVNAFIEIGPGKVLRGLVKKIVPEAKLYGAFTPAEIEATVAELSGIPAAGSERP